jgi:hypothetical protein
VADTIYTRALGRAAQAQGSTQALASYLHVPENTLLRWMAGRAQMPLQAFLKLVELLGKYENGDAAEPQPAAAPSAEKLRFTIGELAARCARCDGEQFQLAKPGPLRYTSALLCSACGENVVHGNLICQLAKDAVWHTRALTVARTRRRPMPARPRAAAPVPQKNPLSDDGAE